MQAVIYASTRLLVTLPHSVIEFGVMIFLFGKQANLEAEILSFYEVLEFIGTPNLFMLFFLESQPGTSFTLW